MQSPSPSSTLPSNNRVRKVIHRVLILTTAAGLIGGLAACNTTRGLGRDVKKVGNKIENAAS